MELSNRQLAILTDRLRTVFFSPNFVESKDGDFIYDEVFESMICLLLDIDILSANKILRAIYEDVCIEKSLQNSDSIINKHMQQYLSSTKQPVG